MSTTSAPPPSFPTAPPEEPVDADLPATDEAEPEHRRWFQPPSALQAVALVVALLFFGGIVGWLVQDRASEPDPSAVDVGFFQDMITHHEQALELSFPVVRDGADSSVRQHAQEILLFQVREIGIMQTYLQQWGVDINQRPDQAMTWMDMTPVPVHQMPGLATDEQLGELQAATGADADQLFLELMIRHHLGGIHMAEYAAEHASEATTRELAEQMATVQSREVGELRAIQERLGYPITE
jgi:uncharacterized protein (DUF305 family)